MYFYITFNDSTVIVILAQASDSFFSTFNTDIHCVQINLKVYILPVQTRQALVVHLIEDLLHILC